ncbi:MAG: hypothetical protein ACHREM_20695 [Polyangiales bacterium]
MAQPPPGGRPPAARKLPGPHYDLKVIGPVFRLAALGKKKAVYLVAQRVGVGDPDAERFIREKLARLRPENYESTVEMEEWGEDGDAVIADVYGVSDEHGGWYIKFYVEHGRVQLVSCHEPEHDMTCTDGTKVKGQS